MLFLTSLNFYGKNKSNSGNSSSPLQHLMQQEQLTTQSKNKSTDADDEVPDGHR